MDKPLARHIEIRTLTAATTGTVNKGPVDNGFGRGVRLVVDMTAVTGTGPTLDITIEGYCPMSLKTYTLLACTQITATGTSVFTVHPDLTAAAGSIATDVLPAQWNVKMVIAGTTPAFTGTISASQLA